MTTESLPRKLNFGCGTDLRPGYLNVDIAPETGADLVHDLRLMPWPLPSDAFDEILFIDILEHLPDTLGTIEELWRVAAPGARLDIRVPHWNSRYAWKDPQHVRPFQEEFFNFFDPDLPECRQRPYYSKARFHLEHIDIEGTWLRLSKAWKVRMNPRQPHRWLHLASKFSDVVHFLTFRLNALKEGPASII